MKPKEVSIKITDVPILNNSSVNSQINNGLGLPPGLALFSFPKGSI